MSTDHVLLNKEGGLWRVTLNRPDKANALSDGMLHRLSDIFSDAASDEDLRVLVITGAGERVFCAGADLSELNTDSDDPANQVWRDLAEKLATLPALTIAMINGSCIGGALMLALGCDIRIAVPEAAFGYPVLKNGVLLGTRDAARMRA
ncbi:MAG: enoyl-CoA hydratase/isomerase family protein, partial [Rhodospirillales bacterium]|nr:enoyl-CoA hydratase/isomerase family protein [Rhodospirillales bacterium]